MRLQPYHHLVVLIDDKLYDVVCIARSPTEANMYCTDHPGCSVMDELDGLIFITKNEPIKPKYQIDNVHSSRLSISNTL